MYVGIMTTEKSTILSCPARLELKREREKRVIVTIMSAEFVIRVENFAY